jgi:cyclopropane fatty-acyl-phospholipid synthase-like methyltransferase
MNPTFWNERFSQDGHAYGQAPNAFLAEQAERLSPGASVLELGAGEGRNAVYLAERGFRVTALDFSSEGVAKTRALARERGVEVETIQGDIASWEPDGRTWDAVVMTFLHLPSALRTPLYEKAHACLAPGGLMVGEWFRTQQFTEGHPSGGPKSLHMLLRRAELERHFGDASAVGRGDVLLLEEAEPVLDEGAYHQGTAATVRLVWQRAGA